MEKHESFRLLSFGTSQLLSLAPDVEPRACLGLGKPLALLLYLTMAPRATASRDELIELLWSDSERERGRASLRQAIWQLRSLLGAEALTTNARDVIMARQIQIDWKEFNEAIARDQLERAIELHAGDFLDGAALPGAGSFERWAALQREVFRSSFLRALELTVKSSLHSGQHSRAIQLAIQLRQAAPDRESSWRVLLESLLAGGQRGTARLEADALEQWLASEERDPDPATAAALGQVRQPENAGYAPSSAFLRAELVGRRCEFARLVQLWHAAAGGSLRYAAVSSNAGLGKTRLLEEIRSRLRSLRARIAEARAHPGERDLEFSLVAELAQSLGSKRGASAVSATTTDFLLDLAPALGAHYRRSRAPLVRPRGEKIRLAISAMVELVECICAEGPLAILVDDVHWSDSASRQILAGMASRLRGEPLLLIGASRESDDLLVRGQETVPILLKALSPSDSRDLVQSIARLPDVEWAQQLASRFHEASAGSPFRLIDMLRRTLESGALFIVNAEFSCDDSAGLLSRIESQSGIGTQLEESGETATRLAKTMSVAGWPLSVTVLMRVIDATESQTVAHLMDLAALCVATPRADRWQIAHDEIADDIGSLVHPTESREMLLKLGIALAASGDLTEATPQRIARCFLAAGDTARLGAHFRAFVDGERAAGVRASAQEFARLLLGESAEQADLQALGRTLPLWRRSRTVQPILWTLGSGVVAALLGIAAFASSRLTVERGPSFLGPDVINGGLALYPEPKLALAGRFGQRGSARGDSISARVVGSTRTLVGDTVVPLRDGKAVFDRMGVRGLTKDSMTIEFHSRRTGATTRFWLPSGASSRDRLTMNAASINGTRLSRALDTVVVHPGDSLSGSIETQYTSSDPAATVVLGMTPTWGRHEKEAQLVGYLLPTAQDRNRQESIRLKAPEIPGTYHLVFVFGAEANERFLLSGTNWTIGRPEWEDSNDVASIPAPELLAASERGYDSLVVPELHEGHRRSRLSFFGLTALTVIVK